MPTATEVEVGQQGELGLVHEVRLELNLETPTFWSVSVKLLGRTVGC